MSGSSGERRTVHWPQFLRLLRSEVVHEAITATLAQVDQKPSGANEGNISSNDPSQGTAYPNGYDLRRMDAELASRYSLILRFDRLYDVIDSQDTYDITLGAIVRRISMESSGSRTSRRSQASRATLDSGYYSTTAPVRRGAPGINSPLSKSSDNGPKDENGGDERDLQRETCRGEALGESGRIEKSDIREVEDDPNHEIEGGNTKKLVSEESARDLLLHDDIDMLRDDVEEEEKEEEDNEDKTIRKEGHICAVDKCTSSSQTLASSRLNLGPLLQLLDRNAMTLRWVEGGESVAKLREGPLLEGASLPSRLSTSQTESAGESVSWCDEDQDDQADFLENHVLWPLRSTLATYFFDSFQTSTSGSTGSSSAAAQGTGSSQTKDGSSRSSLDQRRPKRKISNGSSNDNEEHRAHRRKFSGPPEDVEQKLLACPFCKHNPRQYRDCYKYILRDVSRLKQHLSRRHRIPLHCPSCSQEFDSELDRDLHIRMRSCEVLPPRKWDGIDETKKSLLERRISTKEKTKEENWYIIYEILFPDTPRPRSPYIDAPLSDELLALQEFTATEGPALVSEFTRTSLPETLRPQEDEIQAFLETMFQDAVGLLLERYATSLPAQLQTSNVSTLSMVQSNSSESGYMSNDAVPTNESAQNAVAPATLQAQRSGEDQSDPALNGMFGPAPWNPLFGTGMTEMDYHPEMFMDNYEGLGNLFRQHE